MSAGSIARSTDELATSHLPIRMVGYRAGMAAGGISNYIAHLTAALQQHHRAEIAGAEVRRLFSVQPYAPHEILHIPLIMGSQALLTGRYRRSVVTVHDLGGLLSPLDRSSTSLLHKLLLQLALIGVRRASHILAVSEYTKSTLVKHLNIAPDRIHVTYEGVDQERYQPRPQPAARKLLADRIGLMLPVDQPVLLYVGSELPRKNLVVLWAALKEIRAAYPQAVVLKVGQAGGQPDRRATTLREIAARGVADAVRFLDAVDDTTLPLLYNAADIFVQPSLYEGFSLPTAEAMASGCPVIAANATCLPEVIGGAGVLFDPYRPSDLAARVIALHENRAQQQMLAAKGIARATVFSWRTTAQQTLAVYTFQAISANKRER